MRKNHDLRGRYETLEAHAPAQCKKGRECGLMHTCPLRALITVELLLQLTALLRF